MQLFKTIHKKCILLCIQVPHAVYPFMIFKHFQNRVAKTLFSLTVI